MESFHENQYLELVPAGKRFTALISNCRSSSGQFLLLLPPPPVDFSAFLDACRMRASASSFSFRICSFISSIYTNITSKSGLGLLRLCSVPRPCDPASLCCPTPTLCSSQATPWPAGPLVGAGATPRTACLALGFLQPQGQGHWLHTQGPCEPHFILMCTLADKLVCSLQGGEGAGGRPLLNLEVLPGLVPVGLLSNTLGGNRYLNHNACVSQCPGVSLG